MTTQLKLMCILAHPDDESLGTGGTLARYSAEGVETHVITATRGERGRFGDAPHPGLEVVGQAREQELRAAAKILGVHGVHFLDYIDGDLDKADPQEAVMRIVEHLRRIRPHVVITFGPEGAYGHPDHVAICQFATAAIVRAADASYHPDKTQPHAVSKLYYMEWDAALMRAYFAAFREIKIMVDGSERGANPWPDWAITTTIDTEKHWETVWRAVQCHKTQISIYKKLEHLSAENHRVLWGRQPYYRVFSLVNGGRHHETDLFEGLR